MSIEYVLFDHDETLLATFAVRVKALEIAVREVLGRALDGAAYMDASCGQSLEQMMADLAAGEGATADHLVDVYRRHYYVENQHVHAFDGIPEVLAEFHRRRVPMAVVTSKLARGARAELENAGLAGYFRTVVGSEDVTRFKPDPEPLVKAMQTIDAAPGRTLMVGDTAADLLGARSAGTFSAAALWGMREISELEALAPDYRLVEPRELLDIVVPA